MHSLLEAALTCNEKTLKANNAIQKTFLSRRLSKQFTKFKAKLLILRIKLITLTIVSKARPLSDFHLGIDSRGIAGIYKNSPQNSPCHHNMTSIADKFIKRVVFFLMMGLVLIGTSFYIFRNTFNKPNCGLPIKTSHPKPF